MKNWMKLPVGERLALTKLYRELDIPYRDGVRDFEESLTRPPVNSSDKTLTQRPVVNRTIEEVPQFNNLEDTLRGMSRSQQESPNVWQDTLVQSNRRNFVSTNPELRIVRDTLESKRNRVFEEMLIARQEREESSIKLEDYIPPQRRGLNLSSISDTQKTLIEMGYDVGESGADGKLGRNTIKGLQQFLSDGGYDIGQGKYKNDGVDGVLGPMTRAAIDNYNKNVANSGREYTSYYNNESGYLGKCDQEQCAQYSDFVMDRLHNVSDEQRLAAGITGNAWDRERNILNAGGELLYKRSGDSVITDNLERLNPGDQLTFFTGGRSAYQERAGKGNATHTGVVDSHIQHDPSGKAYVYVLHNVHTREIGGYQGQAYRDRLYLSNGTLSVKQVNGISTNFKLVAALRPNLEGNEIISKEPNPNVQIDLNSIENSIASNAAYQLNDIDFRRKAMQLLNLDNEEFYSLSKAALGVLEQESGLADRGKFEAINDITELKYKERGAQIVRGIGNLLPDRVADVVSNTLGKDITGEGSRGWGQIKFNTNFKDIKNLLESDFGLTKKSLAVTKDNGTKAGMASFMILARNYNRLKHRFPEEQALYLAIQQYSRYNLNREVAGKSSVEWAQEGNLDYANKVLYYADKYNLVDSSGAPVRTFISALNNDPRVIRNQTRLFIRE